jgi:hypothetical protein
VCLQVIASNPSLWEEYGIKVVRSQATLLARTCEAGARESRTHSALVTTRRGIRAIAKSSELGGPVISEIITTLTAKSSTAGNAPLLGVVAGVCDRLNAMRPVLQEQASAYYTFYTREIIGSRAVVPAHIADGLHDFFTSSVVNKDGITKEVIPSVEKALLRAPEVVLDDLLTPLIKSLPLTIDLSDVLKNNLLKALLSSIKSTNGAVRDGALRTFQILAFHCGEEQAVSGVAEEVLKNLKETKAADQRALYSQLLDALSPSETTVQKILPGVIALASKEANETALSFELSVVSAQLSYALSRDMHVDASVTKTFVAGLGDKKPTVRRIWAAQCGAVAWNLTTDQIQKPASSAFFEAVADKFIASWEETLANPVTAATSGLVTVAYVLYAIGSTKLNHVTTEKLSAALKKANLPTTVLGSDAKPSFLVNYRVYTKLTAADDILWVVRALGTVISEFSSSKMSASFGVAWAQAVIYMITSTSVPPPVRKEANTMLRSAWIAHPAAVSTYIVDGLWAWLRSIDLEEKDSPATTGKAQVANLHLVLNALCAASPDATASSAVANGASSNGHTEDSRAELRRLLTKLIVLCRQPLLPRIRWLDLCIQSGVDPGAVVTEDPEAFMDEVLRRASVKLPGDTDPDTMLTMYQVKGNAHLDKVHAAACGAAAELAFVAPEKIMPLLIDLFTADLDSSQLDNIGPTEAAIYRTPEGTAFVDVLSQKPQAQIPSKNTKDYDMLMWEEELRAKVAEKQGKTQKKMTADEMAKVKAQLAKESAIREEVTTVVSKLQRGFGIVSGLAKGPPTDAQAWMGPAIHCVEQAINNSAGLLVGYQAARTYLDCSSQVSSRLGTLRQFIGVATLRAQGASQLAPEYEAEPLGGERHDSTCGYLSLTSCLRSRDSRPIQTSLL